MTVKYQLSDTYLNLIIVSISVYESKKYAPAAVVVPKSESSIIFKLVNLYSNLYI